MQKEVEKPSRGPQSQFQQGHQVPVEHHKKPGLQADLENPKPVSTKLPTEDGGYQTYKAAGKLSGKNAIITGGDSGIGRAVAILFAMEGASSLITYLPEEEKDAQKTKRQVEANGQKCYCFPTDLRDAKNCQAVVDAALKSLGSIDVLVNNVGTQTMIDDIKDLEESQWESTFDTNIHPIFYLSKYTIPHLKSGSTIINCASVNHYIGRPDLLDYTSTKGAIVAFTRGLSNQQVKNGIRVNCVCPGPIWTPLIPATMNTTAQEQFSSTPMGRPGQPKAGVTSRYSRAQSLISEIRARLSSVIFGLSEVNLTMMISSQKSIESALRCFVDHIRASKREASVVSDVLNTFSKPEEIEAWPRLLGELVAIGIASDLLTLSHDFDISTLRKIIETNGPLPVNKKDTAPVEEVHEFMEPAPNLELERQRSLDDNDWLANEPADLPFLPFPPKGFSFSDKRKSYSSQTQPCPGKKTIREDFPIPVMLDTQDSTDTQKQALPVEAFPIPPLPEANLHYNEMNLPEPVTVPFKRKPFNPSLDLHPFKVSKENFIAAIKVNQHQTVQTLLQKGADPNTQNTSGQTALMAAVSFGHESITRLLLTYGADINTQARKDETALATAAAHGYDGIARILIALGAHVDVGKGTGKTALSQAATYGQDRIVELLLDCGADIDAVNWTGETALAMAALNGNMRVARVLLERGAAVDLMRYPWQTPLYKAVLSDEVEMARLLGQYGADPFIKGGIGRKKTVFTFATNTGKRRFLEVFEVLGYHQGQIQYRGGQVPYQYC
ncbi:Short-chain dehydrogenase/reductase SDR [Penicillium cf. griseofulvum]|nr:Short-chain dehydrogenase/reductase SDR [Penicillium cf. griseofulvum]